MYLSFVYKASSFSIKSGKCRYFLQKPIILILLNGWFILFFDILKESGTHWIKDKQIKRSSSFPYLSFLWVWVDTGAANMKNVYGFKLQSLSKSII